MSVDSKMLLTQHLEELRRRLIICVVAVGIGFAACYFFKEKIFEWLMRPMIQVLPDEFQKLIYTAPHEAFMTYLKISLISGIGVAMPVILFETWRFIAPGLYEHEKQTFFPLTFFSVFLFCGGILFAYFVVFPYGFKFFTSFADDLLVPMISTREYLSFSAQFLLAFGIIFELPIFIFILAKTGLVTAEFLKQQRKVAVVLIFVAAALLTPTPDVFNQCLMAAPLILLYEISVWIAYFVGRKRGESQIRTEETSHLTV